MIAKFKDVIRDFVFGMEDGLVSNLGLVLGVYVGSGETFAVVLAGLASMFAGAFSMSAGSYLSAKSQREVYEQEMISVRTDLEKNPKKCYREMEKVLMDGGLGKQEVQLMLKKSSKYKHPKFVCNYMVQRKVGISRNKLDLPLRNAFAMFFSFLVGSFFPIFPFIIFDGILAPFLAIILTIFVLFLMGWFKSRYTKLNSLKSGLEIVVIGIGAAIFGSLIGWLIRLLA
jgi:vacuolar iron transporter family protein